MNFSIKESSFKNLCPYAEQVMVYGYSHCKYKELANALSKTRLVKRVFDSDVGRLQMNRATRTTLENRVIQQLPIEPMDSDLDMESAFRKQSARECKAALVNLVLENYKRMKEGLEPIPLLFCIDIEDETPNPWPPEIHHFTSKENAYNELISHKEERRAYKLCFDPQIDREIQQAARDTFIFVKLVKESTAYRLERVRAPWMDDRWDPNWLDRMQQSQSKPKMRSWREQLHNAFLKTNERYSAIATSTISISKTFSN